MFIDTCSYQIDRRRYQGIARKVVTNGRVEGRHLLRKNICLYLYLLSAESTLDSKQDLISLILVICQLL